MFFQGIHYLPVVISGVVLMVLGFLWYGPVLFGKIWMKEMGITDEQVAEHKKTDTFGSMAKRFSPIFIAVLVESFVIAVLINSLVVTSITGFIILAVSVWLGFSVPISINDAVFGKDNLKLFLINTGYQLVGAILAVLIIGIWG